jgi:hypothetical protein
LGIFVELFHGAVYTLWIGCRWKKRRSEALTAWLIRAEASEFASVIDEICALGWSDLSKGALTDLAWVYYYFSLQFRENVEIACYLYPNDLKLKQLMEEECHTDNLSPWPGVVSIGEKINHDEFIRRLLKLSPIDQARKKKLEKIGRIYLDKVYKLDDIVRAASIGSYEDGGLERVFRSILTAPDWSSPLLEAFGHFLRQHIKFDGNPETGHGALSRHLGPDDQILPLWIAFKDMLIEAAPILVCKPAGAVSKINSFEIRVGGAL